MSAGVGSGEDTSTGQSAHSFHIPVMGTGFSIDSALRVARFGISSVVSLVDDILIEQMRRYHCEREGLPYEEISPEDEDFRARRITAYLNLLDRLVRDQVEELQASSFEPGTDIVRYFELLPGGALRDRYERMLELPSGPDRERVQAELRPLARPGAIETNIMTKIDRSVNAKGEAFGPDGSDALAAARGFALSTLESSSLVLSAGMNPRLFSYLARLEAFRLDEAGRFPKKITLKVSDYRSAQIQGRFLAKKGVWISEYRIESGLNCGGHAFATKGNLMGPILEELRQNRAGLIEELYTTYCKALAQEDRPVPAAPPEVRITAQGGIGTAAEHALMLEHYGVDSVGWGTPFLLVPEVTNVDDDHLEKLVAATADDVYLSDGSPLQIPFWNLRDSASEQARRDRIESGRPGSTCPNGFAVTTTEFKEIPQCTASRAYQKLKLRKLEEEKDLDPEARSRRIESVLSRSCICHDLAGGATVKHGVDPKAMTAICPGPGIQDFSNVVSLEEMVGHIYGRGSLVTNRDRPHAFIRELGLYVDYLRRDSEDARLGLSASKPKYLHEFRQNLLAGIEYYRDRVGVLSKADVAGFATELEKLHAAAAEIALPPVS